jgi:predicted ATPase
LINVGYGVSQSLPVLVEVLWRRPGTWFAIQQPEVHLHPRAQAALGDLIFTMAATEGKKFLIETHSDFMIDRYRTNMRKVRVKKPKTQVLFFERHHSRNSVQALSIGGQGELPLKQPAGYRKFFIKEQMDILGL